MKKLNKDSAVNEATKVNAIAVTSENASAVANAMLKFFDPSKIVTAADATKFLSNAEAMRGAFDLRFYRAIYEVDARELYKDATYYKGKNEVYCTNTIEYCAHCLTTPIGQSQAYNAIKIGELITVDGMHSIFYKEGRADFSSTQLIAIVEAGKALFDEVKKGKKVVKRVFKVDKKWERVRDENGKQVFVEVDGHMYRAYKQTDEECTLIETLIDMEYISPAHKPKEIAKRLRAKWKITEYGVIIDDPAELKEAEEVPAEAEEVPAEAEEVPAKEAIAEETEKAIVLTSEKWEAVLRMLMGIKNDVAETLAEEISAQM